MQNKIPLPKAPFASTTATRASMKGNRSAHTKPEEKLANALIQTSLGDFERHASYVPGTPDFIFAVSKVAIFLNGCFWHRCPYCNPHFPNVNQDYWKAKFARNRFRDQKVKKKLRSSGWKTLTIWECQVKKNLSKIVQQIITKVRYLET